MAHVLTKGTQVEGSQVYRHCAPSNAPTLLACKAPIHTYSIMPFAKLKWGGMGAASRAGEYALPSTLLTFPDESWVLWYMRTCAKVTIHTEAFVRNSRRMHTYMPT